MCSKEKKKMSFDVVAIVASWFEKNSKVPLSAEEKTIIHEKFQQLELDLELLQLAQDEDMRELCPDKFSLARKWQLREALKHTRDESRHLSKLF